MSNSSNTCNPIELGTIEYANLDADKKHGDFQQALDAAKSANKPIFANFAEWPGWHGCRDAGAIFRDPSIKRAAEELFVPVAFNTYDRGNHARNQAMKVWGAGLANSWWGYLRIVDAEGKIVVSGTKQITSARQLGDVKAVIREALEDLAIDVPDYLA